MPFRNVACYQNPHKADGHPAIALNRMRPASHKLAISGGDRNAEPGALPTPAKIQPLRGLAQPRESTGRRTGSGR
jgi:hypothetical protein